MSVSLHFVHGCHAYAGKRHVYDASEHSQHCQHSFNGDKLEELELEPTYLVAWNYDSDYGYHGYKL